LASREGLCRRGAAMDRALAAGLVLAVRAEVPRR
jgi:hypothetical protein